MTTPAPFAFPLAPVKPAAESTLCPLSPSASAMVLALARGIDPAAMVNPSAAYWAALKI